MASSAEEIPVEGRDEKAKSVGRRLLSKVKTVLKISDTFKTPKQSPMPTTTLAPPPAFAAPAIDASTFTATEATSRTPVPMETNVALLEINDSAATYEGAEKVPRSKMYNEQFEKLFKNSGLDVDPSSFYQMEGHVLRVNKTIRMRVHRKCHQCHSQLSNSGRCEKCNHSFCSQCTRYPPKLSEAEKIAQSERKNDILVKRAANARIWPDPNYDPQAPVVVTIPARQEQKLVFKKVRQRVRRTCCQCLESHASEVMFLGGRRDCAKCAHVRCTDCPRDPPNKNKYPYGYPGDAFGANSVPHYRCHECYNNFPPGVENGTACARCSHEKCSHCARLKPQKVDPGPDPEVVKSVQKKMAAMSAS